MVRGKKDLELAKAGYKDAVDRGDRDEQARWANQVGHACKERGQYVEALKWFRKDYEISTKRMDVDASPPGNLMPTCQSIGEIYLRLNDFEQALIYQRKHFQLAEETDNLVEQQRASTQLGRTYVEIYEQKDDFSALRNAKEYLKVSMDLARILKDNPPSRDSPSFIKELVDSYNNMGLLMMLTDDHRQAAEFFQQGLQICNEEELREDDDARSRIHHNLGRLYSERREWEKAKHHTQTDIAICQRIPHPQGEAKGFINLGEIHFKCHRYEDANRCFERALQVAQSLEDEDDLVATAQKNLEVVSQAQEQMMKLTAGEQQLKKLQRKNMHELVRNPSHWVEEFKLLNELIGMAEELQAWEKHLRLAKRLKWVVKEMGDMEKLGDALETVGESYYNLRNYPKAKKWHLKSWDLCKRIGHLEGQSVAMINYGNALDCTGDWEEALKAYRTAYETAKSQGKTKMLSQQISALENMQYCYFVRLEQTDNAKNTQAKIKWLKELRDNQDTCSGEGEHCSETDNESEVDLTQLKDGGKKVCSKQVTPSNIEPDLSDDDTLASMLPLKHLHKTKKPRTKVGLPKSSQKLDSVSQNDADNQNKTERQDRSVFALPRKRPRVVLLDDDEAQDELEPTDVSKSQQCRVEGEGPFLSTEATKPQTISDNGVASNEHLKDIRQPRCGTVDHERSFDIELSSFPSSTAQNQASKFLLVDVAGQSIKVEILMENKDQPVLKTVDCLMQEIVRAYCCSNPAGSRPLLRHLVLRGRVLQPLETIDSLLANIHDSGHLEATVDCWIPMRLVERYEFFCVQYHQTLTPKLVDKMKDSKAQEGMISASGCDLDDMSAWPLLMALNESGPFSHLDLSHNSIGSRSMQKIQQLIAASNQLNLGLVLDLHDNHLGAASLGSICECPVTLSRLEVLNLSGNELTDAAARYLTALLQKSQALEVLKLENCGLTSRTVLKISSALTADCSLVKLSIGRNNPISGMAIMGLLEKVSSLSSFSELDLTGILLDKPGVEGIASLLKSSHSISGLMLGETSIQNEGLVELSDAIGIHSRMVVKLDLSFCGFNVDAVEKFLGQVHMLKSLSYLNLSGNKLGEKGAELVASALLCLECRLKTLLLKQCHLGLKGILLLLKTLQGNNGLQHLILSGNSCGSKDVSAVVPFCDLIEYPARQNQSITLPSKASSGMGKYNPSPDSHDAAVNQIEDEKAFPLEASPKHVNNVHKDKYIDETEVISSSNLNKGMKTGVAYDSEDDTDVEQSSNKHLDGDCISSSKHLQEPVLAIELNSSTNDMKLLLMDSNAESLLDEIACALTQVEGLRFLDLSGNGLSPPCIQKLFSGWSAPCRWASQPKSHVVDEVVHFTLGNVSCCGKKPCCEVS